MSSQEMQQDAVKTKEDQAYSLADAIARAARVVRKADAIIVTAGKNQNRIFKKRGFTILDILGFDRSVPVLQNRVSKAKLIFLNCHQT